MIRITGHSDDYVTLEGAIRGQVDCYDDDVAVLVRSPNGEAVLVRMRYFQSSSWGCWTAEVCPAGADIPMCPVRVRLNNINGRGGYSAEVEIEAKGDDVLAARIGKDVVNVIEDNVANAELNWQVPS